MFAGRLERAVHLPGALAKCGMDVDVIDSHPTVGGQAHDLLVHDTREAVLADMKAGKYAGAWIATPCSLYSIRRTPQLFSRSGRAVPASSRHLVEQTNELARFTAELIRAADAAGTHWALENPADRGDTSSVAHWEAFADHFPLWRQPPIAAALDAAGARRYTFAFCALGAREQKWTTVAASAAFAKALTFLGEAGCPHGTQRHESVASGYDERGESKARQAGEYPALMCTGVAGAAASLCIADPRSADTAGVADGAALDAAVAARIEELRRVPPAFASLSNLRELGATRLRAEPMPPSLILPSRLGRKRRRGRRRPALPREPRPTCPSLDGWQAYERRGHGATRPAGKIAIRQLYNDGVYEEVVETWWPLVEAAGRALDRRRAGGDVTVPKVPTRVIEEWQRPLWARGTVWDCADPTDCRPVQRSDETTPDSEFPGKRKISRTAFKAVAARLGWHDTDIVRQICGGGIEAQSSCEPLTVLAFHHPGLLEDFSAADKVVKAHLGEEWVAPPVRHLPFVPCRLQPRDVILQDRYRVLERRDGDGKPVVEAYQKPRVTTNSSHGGPDSVNAGVAYDSKAVDLPCVQWLARALAICDEAGWAVIGEAVASLDDHRERRSRDGQTEARLCRALTYCVDAESAYSFCPVQRADWWMQCFVWWDDDGTAGVCVDTRMGFGGAFAPNRFERVSTLVAAYVRSLQDEFDDAQPPPSATAWAADRRDGTETAASGAGGVTTDGVGGARPAYRMIFIDDLAGCALDDEVVPPPEVSSVDISPDATTATGGTFAPPGTRVHVHAQLAVLGLRHVGLEASPGKVTVGDDVTVLGFCVKSAARRLTCPELKRATMRHQIRHLEKSTVDESVVDGGKARRLVGRLNNLSQVFPELAAYLHGGYSALSARVNGNLLRRVRMAAGGLVRADWLELLAVAGEMLETNEGVPIAPDLLFPSGNEPGVAICVTDASGEGGVGGYAFFADRPGQVYIACERWRGLTAEARLEADRVRALRTAGAAALSMPAAELFGSWAVSRAAAAAAGVELNAVIAVTDCMPAACALNRAAGGRVPQMRHLVRCARRTTPHWLAVHVPREMNVDADILSHEGGAAAIAAKAREAGLTAHIIGFDDDEWKALEAAARIGTGAADTHGTAAGTARHDKRRKISTARHGTA